MMPANMRYWTPNASPDYDMSDESINNSYSRHRIDPWDLENYAYIHELHSEYQHQQQHQDHFRRRQDSLELSSSEPSSFGDPAEPASSFYYADLGGTSKRHGGSIQKLESFLDSGDYYGSRYARIDEIRQPPYCQIHHRPRSTRHVREAEDIYGRVSEFGLDLDEIYSQQQNGRVSSAPSYTHCSRCSGRIANPSVSKRRVSYSYGDRGYEYYNDAMPHLNDTRVENSIRFGEQKKRHLLQYEEAMHLNNTNKFKPDNFGLNRFGHLQIDYSYSWNNLDKYIYN